jgi:HEAT repeat protein
MSPIAHPSTQASACCGGTLFGARNALSSRPPWPPIRFPFPAAKDIIHDLPGMDFYHEGDAALLAGRDQDIKDLRWQVLGNPASLLVGPSGVGKSSVIYAGLLPSIKQLSGWSVVATRPDRATGAFFTAKDFLSAIDGPVVGNEGFAELCGRASRKQRQLLVALDQFEDLAYFGEVDVDAISASLMDAGRKHPGLKVLFSYRDDVESLMQPLWQAISHTAAGLPKYPIKRLNQTNAEASLRKLLKAKEVELEDADAFVKLLLDELTQATQRETGMVGSVIYPPFIQMVVQRLGDLADRGRVGIGKFNSLAAAGFSATDQVIMQFLRRSIADLPKHGFSDEDGRRVLVALAHSNGKKGVANESRLTTELQLPAGTLSGLLSQMAKMRLVRRLESGSWEIVHDLMAKSAMVELISEEERRFKQARELLEAKARRFDQSHGALSLDEMKDLWVKREQVAPGQLSAQDRSVLLQSMGTPDATEVANLGYDYGHDIEDKRGEITDPSRWSAPGWYWLSALTPENLLSLAQAVGKTRQLAGAVGYLRIASLVGSHEDVELLANLMSSTFGSFPKLVEDTIETMAVLATPLNLPLIRNLTESQRPDLRKAAATLLGCVGTHDDLAVLGGMASDEFPHSGSGGDLNVREAVAEAIGKLGHRDGLSTLMTMMKDHDSEVLANVAKAIAKIGDAEGLPMLEDLAKAGSLPAQHVAAKAYAELSTHGDLSTARSSLKGGNAILQQGIIWMLRERGGSEDVPLIRELLKNTNRSVAYAAVAAIGAIGNADDLPFLRALAAGTDGNWPIRRAAVRAIGALGSREDISLLREIAARNDGVKHLVGRTAGRVVWQLARREDVQMLIEAIQSPNTLEVIEAAVRALANQFSDGEVLAGLSQFILASHPVIARTAAEAAVHRALTQQLSQFLADHQMKLWPQVLAVFDWHLYAPRYLRDAHDRFRKERTTVSPNSW